MAPLSLECNPWGSQLNVGNLLHPLLDCVNLKFSSNFITCSKAFLSFSATQSSHLKSTKKCWGKSSPVYRVHLSFSRISFLILHYLIEISCPQVNIPQLFSLFSAIELDISQSAMTESINLPLNLLLNP